jgi:hypothetical protein
MDFNLVTKKLSYVLSEVVFIYPITSATLIGKYFECLSTQKKEKHMRNDINLSTLQSKRDVSGTVLDSSSVVSIKTFL